MWTFCLRHTCKSLKETFQSAEENELLRPSKNSRQVTFIPCTFDVTKLPVDNLYGVLQRKRSAKTMVYGIFASIPVSP